jgi:shikimate dehydrogenase
MTFSTHRPTGGHSLLVGLLGWPVSHSFSPAMHQAAALRLGLDLHYLPLAVHPAELAEAMAGLAALGFRGANVTLPHKEKIMAHLDEVVPAAAIIGAVNTVVVDRGEDGLGPPWLTGYNTDWSGFLADLAGLGFEPAGKNCLVLGAGGSARAVAYALATAGGRVHLFARRPAQAQAVVRELSSHLGPGRLWAHDWQDLAGMTRKAEQAEQGSEGALDLIVNATPIGMAPDPDRSPWPDEARFPPRALVYDLVYNPAETRFMQRARDAGCRTANGLGMLIRQGAESFYLWTGLRPDPEIMARAIGASPGSAI